MLSKGKKYQWTYPQYARSLQFIVDDIYENRELHRVYRIHYLNYNYKPRPLYLEMSHIFVIKNGNNLVEI